MMPDYVEGSEAEVEAPDVVDGRLQLPEPKAVDRGEAALREEARTLRHMMTDIPKTIPFVKHANVQGCVNQQSVIRGNQ